MAKFIAWPIHEEHHLVPECSQRMGKTERVVICITEEADFHGGSFLVRGVTP
jgi:hypothetical protein